MQKFILSLFATLFVFTAHAQLKRYTSSSGEMIFSFANIAKQGNAIDSRLRWSPVFNGQVLLNYDFNKTSGLFHGLALRNVGFIYEIPGTDTLKKFRSYNVGVPIGFKLGNLKRGLFLYAGYEFEIPFHYKEKTFVNEEKKERIRSWFTNRQNWYTQSLFVGINFPKGINLKFKYYINEFFNPNYIQTLSGGKSNLFQSFNVNIFYFAVDWNVFKDIKEYNKGKKSKPQEGKKEERYSYLY